MSELIFYNSTEVLYFEIDILNESWPSFKLVLDFILGHGGIY